MQRWKPDIYINKTSPNKTKIRFRIGKNITRMGKITLNIIFLTAKELRTIYKRFDHPLIKRLWKVLQKVGFKIDRDILRLLNRCYYYHQIEKRLLTFEIYFEKRYRF